MKHNFIVLALTAAVASAQDQCSWTPPVSTSSDPEPLPFDPPSNPFVNPPFTPVFSIRDQLCYKKQADASEGWNWFDIEAQIQGYQDTITDFRNNITAIQRCEAEKLTIWKQQYPFSCPATQPTAEDWKNFLPTAEQLSLNS